jgi:hypothetical protein
MIIKVTREHITDGTPDDGESCMVALAIRDQVSEAYDIFVDGKEVKLTLGDATLVKPLPDFVQEHIRVFDNECEIPIYDEDTEETGDYERDTNIIPEFEFELPLEAPPCSG